MDTIDYFENKNHYARLLNDVEYFLSSFKNLIYREIGKKRYDFVNEDEYNDTLSESNIILIELYNKCIDWFDEGGKYEDKSEFEKIKILQKYIKMSFSGRLFNWWMSWRSIKRVNSDKEFKDDDKKINEDNKKRKTKYRRFIYESRAGASINTGKFKTMEEYSFNTDGHNVCPFNSCSSNHNGIDNFEDVMIAKIDLDLFWEKIKEILSKRNFFVYEMYYRKRYSSEEIANMVNLPKQKVQIIIWYSNRKIKKFFRGNKNQ